jgi:outer membrane lipoprotein SlyB
LQEVWLVIRLAQGAGAAVAAALLAALAGCGPDYSPNTYASSAVQQANKVDRGVVIGVRQIDVSAAGVVGTATGAAVGGAAGAQTPGGGFASTLGAIGGGLVGGVVGNTVEHAGGDTTAYEYIVRKPNNDLISVTQKDAEPLKIGTTVLVIAGTQARIVPDYTTPPDSSPSQTSIVAEPMPPPPAAPAATTTPASATPAAAPAPTAVGPTPLGPRSLPSLLPPVAITPPPSS